jgi:hypothetical protein
MRFSAMMSFQEKFSSGKNILLIGWMHPYLQCPGILQVRQYLPENASLRPALISHENSHPVPEILWQIPPGTTLAKNVKYAFQRLSIRYLGLTPPSVFCSLQQGSNAGVLLIGQYV